MVRAEVFSDELWVVPMVIVGARTMSRSSPSSVFMRASRDSTSSTTNSTMAVRSAAARGSMPTLSERAELMTEYGQEREHRREQRTVTGILYVLGIAAVVSIKQGVIPVALATLALLMVIYLVGTALVWRGRRAEARRRSAGAPPSWSAQLPVVAAKQFGAMASGRHSRQRKDSGELVGRVTYFGDELRWEPREADANRGVGPITWDRSWSPEVVRLWGPGSQGCLTLTGLDGTAVDLWIRNPSDLRRTLGLVEKH